MNLLLFAATSTTTAARMADSWPWYVIRGAGFIALFLLFALMFSGIGHVTGLTYKFLEPVKAWAVHKAMAIMLCVAVGLHLGALLFDKYASFSITDILVPFVRNYSNGSPLFGISLGIFGISLGILAAYGIALIVASSLGWIDSKKRTWRWLHYLSYFVILAALLHALTTGSDLTGGILRTLFIGVFLVLVVAVIGRMRRAFTLKK